MNKKTKKKKKKKKTLESVKKEDQEEEKAKEKEEERQSSFPIQDDTYSTSHQLTKIWIQPDQRPCCIQPDKSNCSQHDKSSFQ